MTALLIVLLLAADPPLLLGPDVLLDVPSEKRETSVGQFKSNQQYKVSGGGHIPYYAAPDRNIFPLGYLRENDDAEVPRFITAHPLKRRR